MTKLPQDCLPLIKKILGASYTNIQIKNIVVHEDIDCENCDIILSLHNNNEIIESRGVGMVDAIFAGLKKHYSSKYGSLNSLELSKFIVRAKSRGTKSEVDVELEIRNSYGKIFLFSDNSKSLVASAAKASVAVVEYFSNSEVAFLTVLSALKDAKDRGREDLVTRYLSELVYLVDNTSYSDVLDKLRSEFLNEIS